MTPEQQRVAIAEACGILNCGKVLEAWKKEKRLRLDGYRGTQRVEVPDYLNNLNAMHEAEKMLTVGQRIDYAHQIGIVLSGGSVGMAIPNWWLIHEATAAQRAEAFLRTIGEWEEARK